LRFGLPEPILWGSEKVYEHSAGLWAAQRWWVMKKDIHPPYQKTVVTCACGNTFETRSTVPEIRVDICNVCHPFYTGKQKFVDTTGRVERFQKKFGGKYFQKKDKQASAADK